MTQRDWHVLVPLYDKDPDHEMIPGVTVREILDFYEPRPTPAGAVFKTDVVYGTAGSGGRELKAWVYARADPSERRPAVIFIHGGGWNGGEPRSLLWRAVRLAEMGYVAMVITYRLSGEAKWPAALEDSKCAVRWLKANADRLGADPDRVALFGNSAGGHLASLIALTPGSFEGSGGHHDVPSDVRGAVLLYPATDMRMMSHGWGSAGLVHAFLDPMTDERIRESSPVNHVHRGAPPILTLTWELDFLTWAFMIERFHRALDRVGAPNELVVHPGGQHGWDLFPEAFEDTHSRTVRFLEQILG